MKCRVPCGNIMGHGESCVHGHLCNSCEEIQRLRDGIRYWSYCMSEGMRITCPEKVTELMDFLISLKIAPYYVRNKACEFVVADRSETSVDDTGRES